MFLYVVQCITLCILDYFIVPFVQICYLKKVAEINEKKVFLKR